VKPEIRRLTTVGEIAERLRELPGKIVVEHFVFDAAFFDRDFESIEVRFSGTVGTMIRLLEMFPGEMSVIRFFIEMTDGNGYPLTIES
jgi:hypothetical protein